MEEHNELWCKCKQLIRQKLSERKDADWVYGTWFAHIDFVRFDEEESVIRLSVPSEYVYEYVEHYYRRLLFWAIFQTFKPIARIEYNIHEKAYGHPVNFRQTPYGQRPRISIPDAASRLRAELHNILGDRAQWLPGYDKIADWLTDNKGRGLLCIGTPGLGKTLICKHILPTIFGHNIPVVTAQEMNTRIDDLLKARCVIIDDLGKEDVEVRNYGNRRTPFFELCDAAEQNGNLLIITTNLSTTPCPGYPASLKERYGEAVYSRLSAIMKTAIITGDDMRVKK